MQLKKSFNGTKQRQVSCLDERKIIALPRRGVIDLPSRQTNDFLQKGHRKKLSYCGKTWNDSGVAIQETCAAVGTYVESCAPRLFGTSLTAGLCPFDFHRHHHRPILAILPTWTSASSLPNQGRSSAVSTTFCHFEALSL